MAQSGPSQKFMPYSSNTSSVEAIANRLISKQQKNNLNQSVVTESTYDNQTTVFSNQNLGHTAASISQSSVRSAHMNATSGQGFGNSFGVGLGQSQPRNSVVGSRHIPITKIQRG